MAVKSPWYRIVILGDQGVGKTAMVVQFTKSRFLEEYTPTIEESSCKTRRIDDEQCTVEIFDTGGAEDLNLLRHQAIQNGDAFILVYSTSSRPSFNRVQEFFDAIRSTTLSAPVVLVGNKTGRTTEREVSTRDGEALAKKLGCEFAEGSANDYPKVEGIFSNLIQRARHLFRAANSTENIMICGLDEEYYYIRFRVEEKSTIVNQKGYGQLVKRVHYEWQRLGQDKLLSHPDGRNALDCWLGLSGEEQHSLTTQNRHRFPKEQEREQERIWRLIRGWFTCGFHSSR